MNDRSSLFRHGLENVKIAVSDPVAPAFKGHPRRSEWQTGPSLRVYEQYPLTAYYVNIPGVLVMVQSMCKFWRGKVQVFLDWEKVGGVLLS